MEFRRWTPFTFLVPSRYVDRDMFWEEFDLREWADAEYVWTSDPWNGFMDFATRPRETVDRGYGDCEDFSLVAISWAVANDRSGVGIGFCWQRSRPWPSHVIAYDAEYVYSSGDICPQSPDEWIEDSPYAFALHRHVT